MTDFQASSTWQGQQFDKTCRFLLAQAGAKVSDRPFTVEGLGVEIDAEVIAGSTTLWVEFKGSYQGYRPGLMRTDSVKKGVLTGALLKDGDYPPYIMLTSHLPVIGSSGDKMLAAALRLDYIAEVVNAHTAGAVADMVRRWERDGS